MKEVRTFIESFWSTCSRNQTCAPLWGARHLAGCAGHRQAPGARGAPTRGGRGQIFQLLKSLKAQFAYQIHFPIAK